MPLPQLFLARWIYDSARSGGEEGALPPGARARTTAQQNTRRGAGGDLKAWKWDRAGIWWIRTMTDLKLFLCLHRAQLADLR